MLTASNTTNVTGLLDSTANSLRERNTYNALVSLARGIESYRHYRGQYPVDIPSLLSAKGYSHHRFNYDKLPNLTYAVVTLTDGTLTYQRVLLATQDPLSAISNIQYLQANHCGVTDFSQSDDFCPDPNSLFYLADNRGALSRTRILATMRLDSTLHTIGNKARNGLSDLAGVLTSGDSTELATAFGYFGTPSTCTGTYTTDDIVLSCADLFNPWGQPVIYHYESPTNVKVETSIPVLKADGTTIAVIRDIQT